MTEHPDVPPTSAEDGGPIDGELIDAGGEPIESADHDVLEAEVIDDAFPDDGYGEGHLDEDAEHRAVPEGHDDDSGDSGDSDESDEDAADERAGDVLVLETWQIQLPATGDAAVDAALARLTEVEGLPPSQHPEVYEAVHAGLQEALADLDRG